jgi:SulP family sulfate permease
VITGFTSGIAISIFSSQIKDLLGLHMDKVPADFFARWSVYFANWPSLSGVTVALAAGSLVLIVTLRRLRPNWPGFLIVVVAGALLVATIHLPVATIGTRFGGIPASWPHFAIPHIPARLSSVADYDQFSQSQVVARNAFPAHLSGDVLRGTPHRYR